MKEAKCTVMREGDYLQDRQSHRRLLKNLDERKLSVLVHSLFSSWMLAFLFEGQIFYSLADVYKIDPASMVFYSVAAIFTGLLLCGMVIKTKKAAKSLFIYSYLFFIAVSVFFFFPPTLLWIIGIIVSSFLAGGCVAAWGFYLKSGTPKNERIKTIADMLIISNILMILLNMAAIHISPHIGLAFSMLMLLAAFVFALKLPVLHNLTTVKPIQEENSKSIAGILLFLCLFIAIITINSGLMYQVINPTFAHLEWLTSWYWAIPYIIALFIMRNLSGKANRTYILYVAIAMIGFSFIAFVGLDHSALSYIAVNTLMLGAFGIYDLFWWSILGSMLDFHSNPAKVLGIGLSANVLGVLLGGLLGNTIASTEMQTINSTLLALSVVCVTLALLPLLHKRLSSLLTDHAYLAVFSKMPTQERYSQVDRFMKIANLSERESQVAALLLQGKTYKMIAGELYISENTVKYYVKNIYSKFHIQSRAELVDIMTGKKDVSVFR